MKRQILSVLTACFVGTLSFAQGQTDNNERATPTKQDRFQSDKELQEVVVTGTRNAADVRHLPMTVNVVGRDVLTADHQPSVLPTVMQQVPGLFSPAVP